MEEEEQREEVLAERGDAADSLAAALAEAARLREALAAARAETEALRTRTAREAGLRQALLARGARPEALELLAGSAGETLDADAAADALAGRYGFCFRQEGRLIPTAAVSPPKAEAGALGRDELAGMSAAEINRRWEEVRGALGDLA